MAHKIPLIYENVFGKSAERVVSAAKIKTSVGCYLFDEKWEKRIENTTQYVGTKITVVVTLYDEFGYPLNGKSVDIYHKLDTGTPEKIRTVTIGTTSDHGKPSSGGADIYYTLTKAGTHTFYAQFAGDDTYEGCEKAVRAFAK
jgi:hypothetical protein